MDEMYDFLFITSAGVCILIFFYFITKKTICRFNVRYQKQCDAGKFSFCSYPNCIRCNKNKDVFRIAAEKFKRVLESNQSSSSGMEIHDKFVSAIAQIGCPSPSHLAQGQCPLIFHYPGLVADPVWSNANSKDLTVLEDKFSIVFNDFEKVYIDSLGTWKVNNTPTGSWRIFHLVDQGREVKENVSLCKQTMQIISQLPNVMMKNLFGTVAFSVLDPGTVITEHSGPTNIRLRSHLGLITPREGCYLDVNGKKMTWKRQKCFLFDDSFQHTVTYSPTKDRGPRAVLIVDLWHPDMSVYERYLVDTVFSPY